MINEDVLKYCRFYKGEALIPAKYDGKNEGKLWVAEQFICEEASYLISEESAGKDMENYIESYVGKWAPYEVTDIMNTYHSYGKKD